jgi:integrase
VRLGNWLTAEQGETLWQSPDAQRRRGKRDRALLAVLLACGLRRHEAVDLNFSHLQQREQHWAIVDLMGKAGHTRTVPMPDWVKAVLDVWLTDAGITSGRLFRRVNRAGRVWGDGMTEKVVWHVVREFAEKAGIDKLAPHDLRRTCARLCHAAGGELEQIQFLLGHVSIQTTERYLGCKQRIRSAVNDRIGIEPKGEWRTVGPVLASLGVGAHYNSPAWPPVTRKEYGFRRWSSGCVLNGTRACPSTHSSSCATIWTRFSNRFDLSGTSGLRS